MPRPTPVARAVLTAWLLSLILSQALLPRPWEVGGPGHSSSSRCSGRGLGESPKHRGKWQAVEPLRAGVW